VRISLSLLFMFTGFTSPLLSSTLILLILFSIVYRSIKSSTFPAIPMRGLRSSSLSQNLGYSSKMPEVVDRS
jgi:hypothetical protein